MNKIVMDKVKKYVKKHKKELIRNIQDAAIASKNVHDYKKARYEKALDYASK